MALITRQVNNNIGICRNPLPTVNLSVESCQELIYHLLFISNVDELPVFCFAVCEKQKADLVFLIDQSGSIDSKDYVTMKKFTTELVNSFKVSEDLVRVGLAQFSSTFQDEFYLNQHYTEQAISQHILGMTQLGGGTNIGLALDSIRAYFEASRGSRRSAGISQNLVLITDGESQDDVEDAADRLRALGIEIFAIGIGNVHNLELLQITGTPERLFTVENFGSLEKIKQKVVNTICKSKPSRDPSGEWSSVTVPLCLSPLLVYILLPLLFLNVKKNLLLLQTAASTSPWDLTFLEELELLVSCWSAATPSSRASCQRSHITFPQYKACAVSVPLLSRPTSPSEW